MRIEGDVPQLTNFRGKIDSSHPGYHELNVAAREPVSYITIFVLTGPKAHSATFTSDSPVYLPARCRTCTRGSPPQPAGAESQRDDR